MGLCGVAVRKYVIRRSRGWSGAYGVGRGIGGDAASSQITLSSRAVSFLLVHVCGHSYCGDKM